MLVILAAQNDQNAKQLVKKWTSHDARLLTPLDLSVVGWRDRVGFPGDSYAVMDGVQVPFQQLGGILTLLPWVVESELAHIMPADRSYVASELNAFLVSWLTRLTCPVLNRPAPLCLNGPGWRPEQWLAAAASLGIPVRPFQRRVSIAGTDSLSTFDLVPVTVTVVGKCAIGDCDAELVRRARKLAAFARAELAAVRFSSPDRDALLLGADLFPDLTHPDIQEALLDFFQTRQN